MFHVNLQVLAHRSALSLHSLPLRRFSGFYVTLPELSGGNYRSVTARANERRGIPRASGNARGSSTTPPFLPLTRDRRCAQQVRAGQDARFERGRKSIERWLWREFLADFHIMPINILNAGLYRFEKK